MNLIPCISIILPVYNGEKFIHESIRSILDQSFTDFELIIINDGSIDNSHNIITKFNDKRIKYIQQENQGLSKALNKGIKASSGKLIGRQDADDISLKHRLKKQIEYMSTHPECQLLGTWAQIIENKKLTQRYLIHPTNDKDCKYRLLFDCCFTHSSIIIRKEILKKVGLYNENEKIVPPEDYELWSRIARKSKIANIPEVLVYFRENDSSMTYNKPYKIRERAARISVKNMLYYTNNTKVKEIETLAGIYHDIDILISKQPRFDKIKKVIRNLEDAIGNKTDQQVYKSKINIFIFRIKLKWLLNKTFINKFYILIKPLIKIILHSDFINKTKNQLKFQKKNYIIREIFK